MTEPIPFQPRPDAEQVSRAPYTVVLGQKPYPLTPLTIKASKEWKASLRDIVGDLLDMASADTDDLLQVLGELKRMLGESDDLMLNLLCSYDERIAADREQIEETATALQAWTALMEVIRVEFPFLRSLNALRG